MLARFKARAFPCSLFPAFWPAKQAIFYIFAVFAGEACKNSKNIPFVSAVGAKSAEKGIRPLCCLSLAIANVSYL
jgi:hypothetical protein